VAFVAEKVTLRHVLFGVVRFFVIGVVLPVLHIHISLIYHRHYIISAIHRVVKERTGQETQTTFFLLKYKS
jgi:hypothetical protein